MELSQASDIFAALGHCDRLSVLRLLIRRLPQGVRPSEIAALTGLRRNTVSAHLAGLERVGLVASARAGRAVVYRAEMARLTGVARYVVEDCARGRVVVSQPRSREHRMSKTYNVLFICADNSARSIMAEAILAKEGRGRFAAYSAGTRPADAPHPRTMDLLTRLGHDVAPLRSKSTAEFQAAGAPRLDLVFTVCDRAAAEDCPPWPGQPITAHWGLPDPLKVTGPDAETARAVSQAYAAMRQRILDFASLPFEQLDRPSLQARLDLIGKEGGEA